MFIKRNNIVWIMVVVLNAIVLCYFFTNYNSEEKRKGFNTFKNPQNQISLETLLEILKKQEPIAIQIYYIPFSIKPEGPISEGHIFEVPFLKLTVENIVPFYHDYLENFLHNISTASVKQDLPLFNDFRYCCLVKSKSNKYIRFSISKNSRDAIYINGQPYEVSFDVVDGFLMLLPARDYELAIKEVK